MAAPVKGLLARMTVRQQQRLHPPHANWDWLNAERAGKQPSAPDPVDAQEMESELLRQQQIKAANDALSQAAVVRASGMREPEQMGNNRFFHPELNARQNKMVEMAINGFSNGDIADELDMSMSSVSTTLAKLRGDGFNIPYAEMGARPTNRLRIEQAIADMKSNEEIARAFGISIPNANVRRHAYNKRQPVGERISSKGYKYAFPLIGVPTGGLLSRLQLEDE